MAVEPAVMSKENLNRESRFMWRQLNSRLIDARMAQTSAVTSRSLGHSRNPSRDKLIIMTARGESAGSVDTRWDQLSCDGFHMPENRQPAHCPRVFPNSSGIPRFFHAAQRSARGYCHRRCAHSDDCANEITTLQLTTHTRPPRPKAPGEDEDREPAILPARNEPEDGGLRHRFFLNFTRSPKSRDLPRVRREAASDDRKEA